MRKRLRHVRGEDVGEKIADIGEDGAAFFYRGGDAREVVVEQHHVGGFARQVGATAAHADADVGLPQGRCVVHAVAPLLFQRADDAHFLFRKDASKHDLRGVEREHDLGRTFAIEHRALRRRMHRICQLEIPHYYWNQLLR